MKITEHELRQMYCDDKMTQIEIAEVYNVGRTTISNRMKLCGIHQRTNSESKSGRPQQIQQINPSKPSKKSLENMHWNGRMSQIEIAEKIGVSQSSIGKWMKGYGIKTRTLSEAKLNGDFTGENAGNWQGGVSFEPYCDKFNNKFKEAVRERDDYICQLCRCTQESHSKKLSVHHIHYEKSDCWPDVVTLCQSCNSRVNGDRDYWEQYFENQLLERGLMYWSLSQSKET